MSSFRLLIIFSNGVTSQLLQFFVLQKSYSFFMKFAIIFFDLKNLSGIFLISSVSTYTVSKINMNLFFKTWHSLLGPRAKKITLLGQILFLVNNNFVASPEGQYFFLYLAQYYSSAHEPNRKISNLTGLIIYFYNEKISKKLKKPY